MFNKEEGIMVALETAYQLAGVVDKARTHDNKAILVNTLSILCNSTVIELCKDII